MYLAEFLTLNSFAKELTDFQIKKLKFSNIIKPDSIINLKLSKQGKDVKFEYFDENCIYSQAVLKSKEAGV